MTCRTLPKIEAFTTPLPIEWEPNRTACKTWEPLKATAADDDRSLTIADEIGDRGDGSGITARFVRGFLRRVGSGPITVNINSPGGSFFEGLAIYNMLREHDGEVRTNVLGVAASAASIIAMASDDLRVAKAGYLMIHNASGIVLGTRHEMNEIASLLEQFDMSMAGVYADRSGIEKDKIVSWMDAETFFEGEKAVETGMADGLLDSDQVSSDDDAQAMMPIERVAERAMRDGGMTGDAARRMVARLKAKRRDANSHAGRDAGEDKVTAAFIRGEAKQLFS